MSHEIGVPEEPIRLAGMDRQIGVSQDPS